MPINFLLINKIILKPSGEYVTDVTTFLCSVSVRTFELSDILHIFTVLSYDPDAK